MPIKFKDLHNKYFMLVWNTTISQEALNRRPDIKENYNTVLRIFPNECTRLNGKNKEWEQGFNSGCLAMSKLILAHLSMDQMKIKIELDRFPNLDLTSDC